MALACTYQEPVNRKMKHIDSDEVTSHHAGRGIESTGKHRPRKKLPMITNKINKPPVEDKLKQIQPLAYTQTPPAAS